MGLNSSFVNATTLAVLTAGLVGCITDATTEDRLSEMTARIKKLEVTVEDLESELSLIKATPCLDLPICEDRD